MYEYLLINIYMFLSKKNSNFTNKNKNKNPAKKALGGWDDDDHAKN